VRSARSRSEPSYDFLSKKKDGHVGYSRLMELRTEVELALGAKVDRRGYHDFILAQGLVPPRLLRDAVMHEYVNRTMR